MQSLRCILTRSKYPTWARCTIREVFVESRNVRMSRDHIPSTCRFDLRYRFQPRTQTQCYPYASHVRSIILPELWSARTAINRPIDRRLLASFRGLVPLALVRKSVFWKSLRNPYTELSPCTVTPRPCWVKKSIPKPPLLHITCT